MGTAAFGRPQGESTARLRHRGTDECVRAYTSSTAEGGRRHMSKLDQCTMFTAIAGVIELLVFLPAGNIRTPRMTPTLLLKLYSNAGARPKARLEPEFRMMD